MHIKVTMNICLTIQSLKRYIMKSDKNKELCAVYVQCKAMSDLFTAIMVNDKNFEDWHKNGYLLLIYKVTQL